MKHIFLLNLLNRLLILFILNREAKTMNKLHEFSLFLNGHTAQNQLCESWYFVMLSITALIFHV